MGTRSATTASSVTSHTRKRKLPPDCSKSGNPALSSSSSKLPTCSERIREDRHETTLENKPKRPRRKADENGEKRLRKFRTKAPRSFNEVYQRATTQRFYVLGRSRGGTAQCPEETIELTGSTGNIYSVHVARQPTCTCPHSRKGNQCKHVIYVMSRVLRARLELIYQLALLSTELAEIFDNAPPIEVGEEAETPKEDKNRKELDGDCPICFMPFEADDATVYCRAQCGQNIHKECFEMWAATKRQSRGARDQVTCPMCRTPWQGDDEIIKKIRNTGVVGSEGYVNVADQLGISTNRGKRSSIS